MKLQDIIFFFSFLVLAYQMKPRFTVIIGLFLLLLSMPLFAAWIFFTAQRFTWYAAAFFLLAIGQYIYILFIQKKKT